MPVLRTAIDRESASFQENRAAMLSLIDGFRAVESQVLAADERASEKFAARGQLTPRRRIELLLDPGAPFYELSSLAGYRMHDDSEGSAAGGGLITGIGSVAGVRCLVMASNSAVKGGTVAPMGLRKSLRAQAIALENKLPVVNLVESGGANLNYQAEIFLEGGRSFANQARLSAAGIPQITVVHGNATAGGAYMPGLSDVVIMVRNRARVFLAGPPLVRAATGEIADEEALGGAVMHAGQAGTAEFLAADDREAVETARETMAALGWRERCRHHEPESATPPLYPADDLPGLVPVDFRKSYDVREVIARIADGSRFLEFKADFEPFTICGFAAIGGYGCGIIGNNGPIDTKGAVRATQFIQLCCANDRPLIYLQNTTGYMVGARAEREGIVKHGAKMIQAVANASVPQITLMIGASFGAGNYGMCGRGMDPRFAFSWPNARLAVMGGRQAARVLGDITRAKLQRTGKTADETALARMEQKLVDQIEGESDALYATARLWDDGIIDPRDTRPLLTYLLSVCREAETRPLSPTSFGVARM